MEYHGKFGHTIGRMQHISLMIIFDICYAYCYISTKNVTPTLPGFRGIKICIQYMAIHPQ